jgi:hypothetical protein
MPECCSNTVKMSIENMACCGNCKNYRYGNLCDGKLVSHDSWCDSWEYDGLIRKERTVMFE